MKTEITKQRCRELLKKFEITNAYWMKKSMEYTLNYLYECIAEEFYNSSDHFCATDDELNRFMSNYLIKKV